jgi:hypothetical protein
MNRNISISENNVQSIPIVLSLNLKGRTVTAQYRAIGKFVSIPVVIVELISGTIIITVPALSNGSYLYQVFVDKNQILTGNLVVASSSSTSVRKNVIVKTSAYAISDNDEVIICNSGTAFTVTMPRAIGSKKVYYVCNVGTGTVTIECNGMDVMDASTTQTLYEQDTIDALDYDLGKWKII